MGNMKVLIIDGQGGRMGGQLVKAVTERFPEAEIMAVGTNSTAAAAMVKSGAVYAATGENAVMVACRKADVIIGPVGIVIADSLYGEVTPGMALAVARSSAVRILLPLNRCENIIAGVQDTSIPGLLEDAMRKLALVSAGADV